MGEGTPNGLWYVADGVAYVPVPHDPADAYELYHRDAAFRHAIEAICDRRGTDNVEPILNSGPNCFEVDERLLTGGE